MPSPRFTRPFLGAVALSALLGLSACDKFVSHRGVMPDIDAIASIEPHKSTRADVERALGSPSSMNTFGEETWMYIGETTERLAFMERQVNERSVLLISFDADGLVKNVTAHGLEASRPIEPVERQTPTVGRSLTVIEQLMGNLNRLGKIGEKQ